MPAQLLFKKKRLLVVDREWRRFFIKNGDAIEETIDVGNIKNLVHNNEKLTILFKDSKRKSLVFSFLEKHDIKSFLICVKNLQQKKSYSDQLFVMQVRARLTRPARRKRGDPQPRLHEGVRVAAEQLRGAQQDGEGAVSYTHLTLPTNREV